MQVQVQMRVWVLVRTVGLGFDPGFHDRTRATVSRALRTNKCKRMLLHTVASALSDT